MPADGVWRQALQQRQGEPGGLAGAGLGARQDIASCENHRYGLALYRGRFSVALFGYSTEQFGRKAEIVK